MSVYLPYEQRTPDSQYMDLLRFVRHSPDTHFVKHPNQTIGRYFNLATPVMNFQFSNGFPIITDRKISFWKTPITELILFINGARRIEQMKTAGLDWWDQWLTPEKAEIFGLEVGDMGPGSYGPVLHDLPDGKGGSFNQVEHLVQSLKDGPNLNRHIITTFFPPYAMQHSKLRRQAVVAPCHGTSVQCTVIDGKKLSVHMTQASCDVAVGGVANIIQWATLPIMLAQVCGYEPYQYIHKIVDAQIYENQIPVVDKFLKGRYLYPEKLSDNTTVSDQIPFPTLNLTEEGLKITNIFDFTANHFELTDYNPKPGVKFPVTN